MFFYKIEAELKENTSFLENRGFDNRRGARLSDEERAVALELSEASKSFYHKSNDMTYLFAVSRRRDTFVFGVLSNDDIDVERCFRDYAKKIPLEFNGISYEETTFSNIYNFLNTATHNTFIDDDDEILRFFGIQSLVARYRGYQYGESMITDVADKSELIDRARELMIDSTLSPEIERIYQGSAHKYPHGHPVHYLIKFDETTSRKEIWRTLLQALYANKRVKSRRYCYVDFDNESDVPYDIYDTHYRSCENGAMVVRYTGGEYKNGSYSRNGSDVISHLCETAAKYKNKVLTIFCIPKNSEKLKEKFYLQMEAMSFVEIYEDVVSSKRANEYLKAKAKKMSIRTDKHLLLKEAPDQGFSVNELNRIFEEWYDKKLTDSVYPQYKTATKAKSAIQKAKPKGSAYERLQKLVGLSEAKKIIEQALNYYKVQKMFSDRGLNTDRPAMHMVFFGNPGTAKTTVARLFAEIMKENGVLSIGDLYEVGRSDLVGKYVGHTAPLVKSAFKKARGSVLFIDEAYSLVDDRDGMYGDEAINTIVQEMENNREDMVVIFAGYPDKMEKFLNKNPGLRSRIAFNVPFADYSTEDLCEITELITTEKGFKLSEQAKARVAEACEKAMLQSDFGNGRFARNLVEKARMLQANRLVAMDIDSITDEDIFTLRDSDIEVPEIKVSLGKCIGF